MERTISNGYRDCTVLLDGTECRVMFDHCYRAFAVMNDSTEDVFVSIEQGKNSGEDGVRRIAPGCSSVIAHMRTDVDTVYVTGSGSVQISAQNGTENPFKPQSGGGDTTINGNVVTPSAVNGNIKIDGAECRVYDDTDIKKYADSIASNPNLLINPDFRVNQRGQAEYIGLTALSIYTIDRWHIYGSASKLVVNSDSVKLSGTIRQNFEIPLYENITYTLSVMIGGQIFSRTFYASSTGEYATITNGIKGLLTTNVLQLSTTGDVTSIDITWVKLELGSIATPFVPPDPATELVKCQRYYQNHSSEDINPVDLRPNMRITPTITQLSDGNYAYDAEIY